MNHLRGKESVSNMLDKSLFHRLKTYFGVDVVVSAHEANFAALEGDGEDERLTLKDRNQSSRTERSAGG